MEDELVFRCPTVIRGMGYLSAEDLGESVDWGLRNNHIADIHKFTKGEGQRIAVLDTGAPQHKDIGELAFALNTTTCDSVYDVDGHSTHVHGIIRAKANGFGVQGVAPDAEIGSIRVLDDDGDGKNSWIAKGIDLAIAQGVSIINISIGGSYSASIEAAIKRCAAANIIVVCAAGNNGFADGKNTVDYPAKLDSVLAIASYNKEGKISDFSSAGPEVDFAFPGENVLSTWLNNGYRKLSGTSMASPFATATCALIRAYLCKVGSMNCPKTTNDMRSLLIKYSHNRGAPTADNRWGWGKPALDQLFNAETATTKVTPAPAPAEAKVINWGNVTIHWPVTVDGKSGLFIESGGGK